MQLSFTAVVDQVNCHIRAYGSDVVPQEKVNQRPHKHYFMEFHYVFAGEETVILPTQQQKIRLRPGQILMLPKNSYHGATTEQETVERMCFNFSAESEEKRESPLIELYQTTTEPMVFEDTEIDQFMLQCRHLQRRGGGLLPEAQQGLLLLSVVLRLLERVSGAQAQYTAENTRKLRQKWIIEDYIEQHFTDNTGMEGLAKALYLSQQQTRKLVRQFMGEDFKTIMIRRRMELAEIYLRDPDRSLEEIAWQVGYRSYSGFQLCFKRYFGVTPVEKRKQMQ